MCVYICQNVLHDFRVLPIRLPASGKRGEEVGGRKNRICKLSSMMQANQASIALEGSAQ